MTKMIFGLHYVPISSYYLVLDVLSMPLLDDKDDL